MLLSKKIISNFISNISKVDDDKISEALNAIGAEVENITYFPKTDYLKIGKIISIKKHPHADNLTICKVQLGPTQYNDIICGAKNVMSKEAINKYVIVALEGAELPDGKSIVSKDIHGVISEGMICSYSELNPDLKKFLSIEDYDNVILLDQAKIFDKEIAKYINTDDTIFDISLPTNRPDWQGVRFICKEIAAYLKEKFNQKISYSGKHRFIKSPINASNEAGNKCHYFGGIYLRNKKVQISSWNLKGILMNNEIRPINDIVDNSVLISLFTGNPIHVHDADKIEGKLVVRVASKPVEMLGLDNKIYQIIPGDLIICDDMKIVALAGIIGSKATMVTEDSTNFFIEIGNFQKDQIIATANRLKLKTLASQMFSKNITLYATKITFEHMYEYLIKENVYQQISLPTKNIDIKDFTNSIIIDFNMIKQFLGITKNLSDLKIKSTLKSLGFSVSGNLVLVPSHRTDIKVWQDLAEELVKIININLFESEPIVANYLFDQDNSGYEMIQSLVLKLQDLQISNVHTYNLSSLSDAKKLDLFGYNDPMRVLNYSSNEHEYFRLNIITNLLKVLEYNKVRKNPLRAIYEIQNLINMQVSNMHIGIVVPIELFKTSYNNSGVANNLLTMKGLSEIIIRNFGFNCKYEKIDESKYLVVSDSLKLVVYQEIIGYIGKLRSSIAKEYNLEDYNIYVLDINLEPLINSINRIEHQYEPISNLQNIDRDITFKIAKSATFENFVNVIDQISEIVKWELISIYDSKQNIKEKMNYLIEVANKQKSPTHMLAPSIFSDNKNNNEISNETDLNSSKSDENYLESNLIKYTVRYYIQQKSKTLSIEEINKITEKLNEKCKENLIIVEK